MPKTTASMIKAARTGFGRSENRGARANSVNSTTPPVTIDAICVRAPAASLSELAERLVDTGIPWKNPAVTLDIPWATDSWSMSMR